MLRRRVATALLALVLATAAVLTGLLYLADEWVEDAALQDLMEQEMSFLVAQRLGNEADAATALSFLHSRDAAGDPAIPEALRALPPGLHQAVKIDGVPWRVLVRDLGGTERAWLLYRIGFIERREGWLRGLAMAAILGLLAATWAAARVIARRALAPLEVLVEEIGRLDPGGSGQRLTVGADGEPAVIARAMNGYIARLESLVERERAFAAGASHELRTPLALIQGSAEQIAGGERDPKVIDRLRRGVRAATEQLEALLTLSRTRESPPSESLRLDQWLPGAVEALVAGGASAGRVSWTVEPTRLTAPPGVVRIVFGNLLQNALRADPRGTVDVRVSPGCVAVEDRGPGLAPEVLQRAFEPGFRGQQGGSGMGLYIARTLAERYGWTLSLDNRPGGGARAEWRFAADPV